MGSAGQSADASAMTSCHHRSRPSCMSGAVSQRLATITFSTEGAPVLRASSTVGLSRAGAPRRQPASAVMIILASASSQRSTMASAEKPPKMTEWATPMRAQASMAIGSSRIIGM